MLISTIFFSCFSSNQDKNDVFIRIENATNQELYLVNLGTRIIKKNSYRSKDYITRFKKLEPNNLTEYKNTKGSFLGYARINIQNNKKKRIYLDGESFLNQINKLSSNEGVQTHPYNGTELQGPILEKGYYTFKLFQSKGGLGIEIIRNNSI